MAQTTPQYVGNAHYNRLIYILVLLEKNRMGNKGDKLTKDSDITAELLIGKLKSIDGVSAKKMFGGHGIFHDGKMFGIVDSKGTAFLKANDMNRADYEAKKAQQHSKMPYFSIPDEVMNDLDTLLGWAQKSIEISK